MLTALLTGALLTGAAHAAPLAKVGETIGGVPVTDLLDHPEFHRIQVRLDDGRTLTIEVVATDTPRGACTHHGFAVQPRWELLDVHDMEVEDQPPVVTELCARLEASPPGLDLAAPGTAAVPETGSADPSLPGHTSQPTRAQQAPDGPPAVHFRPLHGVLGGLVLTFLAGLALVARRHGSALTRTHLTELAAVSTIGLALRALLGLWAPLWSPWFGFGRFASVLGDADGVSRYGDGYAAIMTAFTGIFGPTTTTILGANFFLGALVPPLVWAIVRLLAPTHRAAPLAAALLAALLPVHVWQTPTEVMHVALVTFQLVSVLSAALFLKLAPTDKWPAVVLALASGLAAVLVVNTRPEAIPFVVVPALLVLLHAKKSHGPGVVVAALTIAAGLVLRLAEMAFDVSDEASALDYGMLADPTVWFALVRPDLSAGAGGHFVSVLMRPTLTSPLLPVLALVGLFTAPRRLAITLGAWWFLLIVPVLPKAWPLADAYRLQVASLMPLLVLAGIGAHTLLVRLKARAPGFDIHGPLIPVGLALAVAPQLFLERPDWGTLSEARFFMAQAPDLDPTATILYDDRHSHAESIAQWGALAAPGTRWVGMRGEWHEQELTQPLMAWISTSCTDRGTADDTIATPSPACAAVQAACTLRPASTTTVPLTGDIILDLKGDEATIGFYFLDECSPGDR